MATADYVSSTDKTKHISKLTSVLEYILQYVEGKKEELESRSIENKKLFKKAYLSHKGECEVKRNETIADKNVVDKNQTNNALALPDQADVCSLTEEQLAEIELIDRVLKKADITWRKHKPISQSIEDNESLSKEWKQILDSEKIQTDTTKVSSNTEDSLKNSDIGVISEAALIRVLKEVDIPKAKPVSYRIPQKAAPRKNPQIVVKAKQVSNTKPSSVSKTLVKKDSKSKNIEKDHSTKILDKAEKNCQNSQTDLIPCSKEQVTVSSKDQTSRGNDDHPTVRSCFTVPTNIKSLWKEKYSLRQKIRKLSQNSSPADSFCTLLETEIESSFPCGKLQVQLLSKQYDDLNKLLQTLDYVCVSDISSPKDILRVKVYITHVIVKTLELNQQTEKLLREAQYSQQAQGNTPAKMQHKSFISKSEIPFEVWLPPYLYQSSEENWKKLSLNLCYSSVTELNKYWQLTHQLQLKILSGHLLELFANSLMSLLTSSDIPKSDKVIIFRVLQGILWHNGEQFPILLKPRSSTS
ncbi:uncharacterized protein LOC115220739 isoform X1 [Octopus sinensis]|uniref:Uncharacterized protein LOC115220739 isoform X1 n=1 Tax=Octopus sinensis TaxID=2607531 RepID=A0A7E6FF57_9MOLL|nr:uncharacterized protein LOC115220739 isoform X1 [Octopus sinensis]